MNDRHAEVTVKVGDVEWVTVVAFGGYHVYEQTPLGVPVVIKLDRLKDDE